MKKTPISHLLDGITLTGDVDIDAPVFLRHHGYPMTAEHVTDVARMAAALTKRFDIDPVKATQAGYLHDISAVIPNAERIELSLLAGIDVFPEERKLPMIMHQRLSVVFAKQLFDITDIDVLSAIGCHTTLQPGARDLDKIVFVADKIAWDQPGTPPWLDDLNAGLDISLNTGVCVYLQYLWDQRKTLACVHPWFVQAYCELCETEHEAPAS